MTVRGLVIVLSFLLPMTMAAASRQRPALDEAQSATVKGKEVKETAMATRGEAVFSKHCTICHLGRPSESRPYIGRNLRGILKNAQPKQEARVREFIAKGSDRMPGFQYNLTAAQVDDLIGYLKTYN